MSAVDRAPHETDDNAVLFLVMKVLDRRLISRRVLCLCNH
jgi:hypothetical protein